MEISINSGVVDLKQRKYFRIQNKYSRGNFKSDATLICSPFRNQMISKAIERNEMEKPGRVNGMDYFFQGIQNLYENQNYTDSSASRFKLIDKPNALKISKIVPCRSAKNNIEMNLNKKLCKPSMNLSCTEPIENTKSTQYLPVATPMTAGCYLHFTPKQASVYQDSPMRRANHSLVNICFTINCTCLSNSLASKIQSPKQSSSHPDPYKIADIMNRKVQLPDKNKSRNLERKWNSQLQNKEIRRVRQLAQIRNKNNMSTAPGDGKGKTRFSKRLDSAIKEFIKKHKFYPYCEIGFPCLKNNNQSQKSLTGILL